MRAAFRREIVATEEPPGVGARRVSVRISVACAKVEWLQAVGASRRQVRGGQPLAPFFVGARRLAVSAVSKKTVLLVVGGWALSVWQGAEGRDEA